MPSTTKPTPLYDPASTQPAYKLRYSLTAWPSARTFSHQPVELLESLEEPWESDGLRLLVSNWTDAHVQLLFSARPEVSPEFLACRAKGRLDHALRGAGFRMPLSRKLGLRSIGDNTTAQVQSYIEKQVEKASFVDERFAKRIEDLLLVDSEVDLSKASETKRGRYWYDLHIVLVTANRGCLVDENSLTLIRDWCLGIAAKKGYSISRMSVMPDHLHLALRGNPSRSPNEIVGDFQNNLAFALGQVRIWSDGFYVGTFGEYGMDVIRRCAR